MSGEPVTAWPSVELRELSAFLTLAEELHYGRTAERLLVTPARVSQAIQTLEAKIGGRLFERTSRRVTLTRLGERFQEQLEPAYAALQAVIRAAQHDAGTITERLRIGFTTTTGGPALSRLVTEARGRYRRCEITLHEVESFDPYARLRRGEIDVLCHYLPLAERDLTAGPALAHYDLVLLVARRHRLAEMSSVSIEDLGGEELPRLPSTFPSMLQNLIPALTPAGRPIRFTAQPVRTINEILSLVAQGSIVWPGIATTRGLRDDVVAVPFRDLPPLVLALIWRTGHENAAIRTLAEVARGIGPDSREPINARTQTEGRIPGAVRPS
jgi:DNA-binding transcriptional LysR family regulator